MGVTVFAAIGLLAVFGAGAAERLPVPDEAAQNEARQIVQEVFGEEIQEAKTPAARLALGNRLAREAEAAGDDPAGRYALLQAALDLAPDADSALALVDRMGQWYRINVPREKASALWKLSKKASLSAEHRMVALAAKSVMEQAASEDDYEVAVKLAEFALAAAQKARDSGLARSIRSRTYEIRKAQTAYAEVKGVLGVLEKQPADPKANLTVGRYKCLVKGDWESGLPMLARGEDTVLKGLATRDLRKPASSTEQVVVADGWYALAEQAPEPEKTKLLERAGYWYRLAIRSEPALAGLDRVKVEKRAREMPRGPEQPAAKVAEVPEAKPAPLPIPISVKEPWPFKMEVKKGQTLHITATGRWRIRPKGKWHGPNDRKFHLRGRLGEGEPFKVGSDCTLRIQEDGVLYLGMREGGKYGNNRGSIQVVIEKAE